MLSVFKSVLSVFVLSGRKLIGRLCSFDRMKRARNVTIFYAVETCETFGDLFSVCEQAGGKVFAMCSTGKRGAQFFP